MSDISQQSITKIKFNANGDAILIENILSDGKILYSPIFTGNIANINQASLDALLATVDETKTKILVEPYYI